MARAARGALAAALLFFTLAPVGAAGAAGPGKLPALPPLPALDPASPSLSPGGRDELQHADLSDAPRYALSARIDPQTGDVDGRMRAEVSNPKDRQVRFRMLAGLPALHTGLSVSDVTVDGRRAQLRLDQTLLTVPALKARSERVVVGVRFAYHVPRAGTTHGRPLTQATIALLARNDDGSQFGHWFPLWLPPGADGDPALSGFGDIGNFAAGAITARVRVPTGWDVASGGMTVDRREVDGSTTVTESGVGLRDLSLVVGRGVQRAEARAGDVTVRAIGPPSIDVDGTARAAAGALQVLADRFGPYPWSELDVIAASLGPDAGGMEWPGAVWIDGLANGLRSSALTIDHELAHQWWHALVGNDSIRAPVVDEPLAQYSMCVVAAADGSPCTGIAGPGGARPSRTECADRPTTAFASASEYGSLIYDQAPDLYFAL
ncbi:MAG TPA: hypothetical protein VKE97_04340, partial [Acidimicrobiia bacterium]|nr:hypothetical protein [Acidimicrobiia bacterium]